MNPHHTNSSYIVYVGTYAEFDAPGLHAYYLDAHAGVVQPVGSLAGVENPSFLALHPHEDVLYAVSERETGAEVAAVALLPSNRMQILNRQACTGSGPCHLSLNSAGTRLVTANYAGGSVSLFSVLPNGHIGPEVQRIAHHGKGVHPVRQTEPHPHAAVFDPTDRRVLVPDLGTDRVAVYEIGGDHTRLSPLRKLRMPDGAGPRHIAFAPGGSHMYVINELNSTITVCAYDSRDGVIEPTQTVTTIHGDAPADNYPAGVAVSASGEFLYASNRGQDSIAVFAVDRENGRLRYKEHVAALGKTPRHFTITPDGRHLLAANQDSDNIATFRIDPETGGLEPTPYTFHVPNPACVIVRPAPAPR
ncbi:MAG: lactonase family protein [Bacilli bacterium]